MAEQFKEPVLRGERRKTRRTGQEHGKSDKALRNFLLKICRHRGLFGNAHGRMELENTTTMHGRYHIALLALHPRLPVAQQDGIDVSICFY
jgi:hypothetical protein